MTAPTTTLSEHDSKALLARYGVPHAPERLVDSPAGQAAWILEKFWAWTDCDGHPEKALTRDELLDNVMLYWTGSIAGASQAVGPEVTARLAPSIACAPRGK